MIITMIHKILSFIRLPYAATMIQNAMKMPKAARYGTSVWVRSTSNGPLHTVSCFSPFSPGN